MWVRPTKTARPGTSGRVGRLVVPFAASGLRIGELAALGVVDFNLATREVRVRATAVGG
jgi:hypothetical protein